MDHADPVVTTFLDWALNDRLRSPHTVSRYRSVLGQLDHPSTATVEQIDAWWIANRGKAPATRENELACLRSFYKWMARFDLRVDNPTRRIDPPKVDNRNPTPISKAELKNLMDACDESNAPDLRRAVALGAYGGMRVSEAAACDWSHVDLENMRIRVRGKGSKERLAGLSLRLMDEIAPNVGGNIVNGGGNGYSGGTLQRKVNRLMARIGIKRGDGNLTFHSLRGRYISMSISRTGNIHAVAEAVGWASIDTASAYAALSDNALDLIASAAAE